jgi:hypothetical protein
MKELVSAISGVTLPLQFRSNSMTMQPELSPCTRRLLPMASCSATKRPQWGLPTVAEPHYLVGIRDNFKET